MYLYQILQGKDKPNKFKIFVYYAIKMLLAMGFPVISNLEQKRKCVKQETKKKIFLV